MKESAKQWGTVISLLLALVTAATAYYESQGAKSEAKSEPKAEAAYDELRKAVEKLADERQKDHDDLIMLRTAVEFLRERGASRRPTTNQAPNLPAPRELEQVQLADPAELFKGMRKE